MTESACTCIQLNGKALVFEDNNYKFCPSCTNRFEQMAAADEGYIKYGGADHGDHFQDDEENQ